MDAKAEPDPSKWIDRNLVSGGLDPILVEITGESVIAEAHVGMVLGGRPLGGGMAHQLLEKATVGKFEVES